MPINDPKLNPSLVVAALQRLSRALPAAKSISDTRFLIEREIELASAASNPRESSASYSQRGRSFFDELQIEILSLVRAARSREDLLELVIARLANGDTNERTAICYVVFEGYPTEAGYLEVRPIMQAGLQPDKFVAYSRTVGQLADSPILTRLFEDGLTVDFSFTEYLRGIGYHGEFDSLIEGSHDGIWLAGVPLPGIDATMPDRALIGLYPSIGTRDLPNLPRGARPEWRLMEFLQTGYALLNHQLEGRAELVAADRRNLISDLAPQAIFHELATQIGTLENQLDNILSAGTSLDDKLKPKPRELKRISQALEGSFNAVHRAKRITDAFNNLDRRTKATVRVGDLLDEVTTIVEYRRKKYGIAVSIDGDGLDTSLKTDAALVEHLILNVVVNAIDAFVGQRLSDQKIQILAETRGDRMRFTVSNNGPSIDFARREMIFEKGVTSKARGSGHGQGLYICRLLASYMLGSIELLKVAPTGMTVAFAIELPIVGRHGEDLMGQRAKSRR
ncbi:ATP-binding protein [Rhodopseudomonas palustris]|uniref:histidine kinase n=1 Tax=Rhodopseudomonas palustris (strain BisB18) TaxID=316056 RepID=Q20ZI1_RHOPB